MSQPIGTLFVVVGVFMVLVVGATVSDQMNANLHAAAINQAEAACNSHLPGEGWTVANHSVNTSRIGEPQSLLCTREGISREINVSITINLKGKI